MSKTCSSWFVAAAIVFVASTAAPAGEVHETLSRELETDPRRAAADALRMDGEVYRMHWKLGGFLGALAGLFVPNSGDALLTFVPREPDRREVQVLITAPKREGEFFVYGAQIDERTASTKEVWSAYVFRDSGRERQQVVDGARVIDFASAIYHLRRNPPSEPVRLTIWNQGRTYPVEVVPLKPQRRKISGTVTEVRGYAVRGVKIDDRPAFKEDFTLYFSRDDDATPLEIRGKRGWIKLRIQLVEEEVRRLAAGRGGP
jgi:hypothetical protein